MKILDLSSGNRAIWFDKKNPLCTFLDIRESVNPDHVCDTKDLKFLHGNVYDLVVWDPPHLNFGANSNMSKCYGYFTTAEILETIEKTSLQLWDITNEKSLMALKWNDHSIKLTRVLWLIKGWTPLFGNRVSKNKRSQTYWVLLRRDIK